MFTVILFIVILSLLVSVHEFGHFVAARKSGMRVYEFGLGFPPRALGVYRDPVTKKFVWVRAGKSNLSETVGGDERIEEYPATVYSLNWLPLGGFCKIKGESGEDANQLDSFGFQKSWKRVTVLVAGVAMNIVLAALLFSLGFSIGLPTDVSDGIDPEAIVVQEPGVIVEQVVKDSPAQKAGVKFGDKILALDNVAVYSAKQMMAYVEAHGTSQIAVHLKRGQEDKIVTATPVKLLVGGSGPRLGVRLADAAVIRYPWYRAIPKGFAAAGIGLVNIFISFYILIKNLVIGHGLAFDVSGPVGIASIVGQSARLGVQYLIQVTAMISLSLAAINILPIPALDGGRVLFVIIEKITRKKVPMQYEQLAHTIGFVLLMVLVVIVTGRDIIGLVK